MSELARTTETAGPAVTLRLAVAEGVARLKALGMDGAPAQGAMKPALSVWLPALESAGLTDQDAQRVRVAFARAAERCVRMPLPAQLLAMLPPVEPPPPTADQLAAGQARQQGQIEYREQMAERRRTRPARIEAARQEAERRKQVAKGALRAMAKYQRSVCNETPA